MEEEEPGVGLVLPRLQHTELPRCEALCKGRDTETTATRREKNMLWPECHDGTTGQGRDLKERKRAQACSK